MKNCEPESDPPQRAVEARSKPASSPNDSARHTATPPDIPDHELLRGIGGGSYGDVWLARNVMGTYRAVKVVYRETFEHDRPYEREFEGIKQFEPISRRHESQVDILQVGQNTEAGYFYYVMELADSADSSDLGPPSPGSPVPTSSECESPETYVPRTLKHELHHGGSSGNDCSETSGTASVSWRVWTKGRRILAILRYLFTHQTAKDGHWTSGLESTIGSCRA